MLVSRLLLIWDLKQRIKWTYWTSLYVTLAPLPPCPCPYVPMSQNASMICQGLGVFSELMQSRFLHTFLSLPIPFLGRSVWSGFSFTRQKLQEGARHAKNPPGRLQVHVLCHSRHDGAAAHGVLHGEQSDLKMSGLLRHTDCNIESYFWQPITNLHVPISHEIIFVLQAL